MAVSTQQESNMIDCNEIFNKKKKKKKFLPASSKFQKFGLRNYSLIFFGLSETLLNTNTMFLPFACSACKEVHLQYW